MSSLITTAVPEGTLQQQATSINKEHTTCCYCGVGCGVTATIQNNQVIAVQGREDHPANFGRLCVKGSSLHQTQHSPERLLRPRVHNQEVSWEQALSYSARSFQDIISKYGPDSVAFYLSGQLLTEDYYVANKLIKGFIGTANVDTNSRLCMASAVVSHKRAFGGDVVPGCYEDLEKTDVLILVGSNAAYAHPVTFQRIAKAKQERPHLKIVVLDPRRTATCDIADIHIPLAPGSDAYFFNGLLSYLAQHNYCDAHYIAEHTQGFEAALSAAQKQVNNIHAAAAACDASVDLIAEVYRLFAQNKKVVTLFSQGINQSSSGVDKGNAIINCHLATGKIGKEGACPFSITGQPNAMGGREVGGLANQLAAHMGFDDQADIDRVAQFWQAPNMAQTEGLKAVDMFKAIDEGKIKAIWIMATNPVVSMPDADFVKQALQKCELVMVSEVIADTDTAKAAHVLLPATGWGEKNGTVTNSERCISLQKGFLPPAGEAKHDWQIISLFAQKMGFKGFDYLHTIDIFKEHAALSALNNTRKQTPARAFDISAMADITLKQYSNLLPIQWPVNQANPNGTQRLFSTGSFFTPSGKANFIAITARLPVLQAQRNEVIMNTGRIRDQWHTMSRTGTAPHLLAHTQEPYVDIHPQDARQLNLLEGQLVELGNRGARYIGRVKINAAQRAGEIFAPMHWNAKYASSARADALVNPFVDPICGQPEFKHTPVSIVRHNTQWTGFLVTTKNHEPQCDYWAKITVQKGYVFRVAGVQSIAFDHWLKQQYPEVEQWQELQDSQGEYYRAAGFVASALVVVFNANQGHIGPTESRWLNDQLGESIEDGVRYSILAGNAGCDDEDQGAVVCACYQVGTNTINQKIRSGCQSAEALGQVLKCGTNCGSCIPELNAMIQACRSTAV
ncbi:nitrate reductase [Marinagarivorans algicola]|uniref:nitrate reductase n=1 Tax=Marinagarivorans algicola TaxID=1513270 RepID=UPI0006B94327|nr:nitrate reductase [Marinagarivorans algicola]